MSSFTFSFKKVPANANLQVVVMVFRKEKVKANIAVVEQWDEVQAKIDADMELAQRLQTEEEEQLTDAKKARIITKGSSKRAGDEIEQESAKRQRLGKEDDSAKLKRCLEIVPDDDDVTIKATPLSSKSPTIVDYNIYKEGKKSYFKIIKADGNSQNYLTFGKMGCIQTLHAEIARKLEAQMKAEMEEEERITREKVKANIAVVEQWDEVQAKIDADMELAQRLQTEEQEQLTDAKKARIVHDLDGYEVIVDIIVGENVKQDATVAKKDVSTAADEVVTTVNDDEITTAATTPQLSKDDVTLAQTLIEIKSAKPRARGVIVQDLSEFRTTSSLQSSQLPKAKDKEQHHLHNHHKKDKISFDKEVARKLEAQMKAEKEEEERIAREKDEANIVVVEQWDEVVDHGKV
nr:hypothetical protein [Tanacetum cinerariifolium]